MTGIVDSSGISESPRERALRWLHTAEVFRAIADGYWDALESAQHMAEDAEQRAQHAESNADNAIAAWQAAAGEA